MFNFLHKKGHSFEKNESQGELDILESIYLQIYHEAKYHHLVFNNEFHRGMRQASFYN